MTSDFIISKAGSRWQVVATSERGRAFAAGHPRFLDEKAELDGAEALAVYERLHGKGYYASVPDGLPSVAPERILVRLALVLGLILLPIVAYFLLI